MSALAKAIIGENDDQIRRIAHSGLPQDKLRLLKIKRACEELGLTVTAIRQMPASRISAPTPGHRNMVSIQISGHSREFLRLVKSHHQSRNEFVQAFMDRALEKSGNDKTPVLHYVIGITRSGTMPATIAVEIALPKLGDFRGQLSCDNTFSSDAG